MSKIALTPNANGTGVVTIASPNTNTDRTITLPDATGTLVSSNASGNVGLGVTPSAWASFTAFQIATNGSLAANHFGGDNAQVFLGNNLYYDGDYKYLASGVSATRFQQAGGAHYWYTAPVGTAGNPITFTQAMTLDASGNLLVGATSGVFGGERFRATTSGAGNNSAIFTFDSTDDRGVVLSRHTGSSGATSRKHYVFLNSGNTEVGAIACTGSATAYNTSSDYRLKENVQPMTGALSVVQQLNPVTYNWIADGSAGQGFIAHELQAIVPDCVTGEKDAIDAEGNPQYQGIDTSFLVATLAKAIQEQQGMIQALQAEVAALKGASA